MSTAARSLCLFGGPSNLGLLKLHRMKESYPRAACHVLLHAVTHAPRRSYSKAVVRILNYYKLHL
jgi:hypothetical protein